MESIFISPARYIQGPNVFKTGLHHLQTLGSHALLLCDAFVYQLLGQALITDLAALPLQADYVEFNGESSSNEIQRLSQLAYTLNCDFVIGLGGGKTIDTAKAIAQQLQCPVAILPTVASTDAPTSAISVLYDEEGKFDRYVFYKKSPDLILVDSEVIAKAPATLLASGIADGLSTWIEARAVKRSGGTTLLGAKPTATALAIARQCETILFEHGLQAIQDCREDRVTEALEAVIEANTLLSGIGFESCGLAAAHAIHNGFTAIQGAIHRLNHGQKIAYTTLTQLMLEQAPKEELDCYIHLFQALELPTTLREMHLDNVNYSELLAIGELATQAHESIHQMPFSITPSDVADALLAVDHYVTHQFK